MAHQISLPDGAERVINTRSPTAVDRAVGARIRRLRRNAGMTLRGLGEVIGVSAVQLQRYETGASRVAASRFIAIADALGASVDALLGAPPDIATAAPILARSNDVVELVRLFGDIRDMAQRQAIVAFVRAMAPPPESVPAMAGPFAPVLSGTLNGIVAADKS